MRGGHKYRYKYLPCIFPGCPPGAETFVVAPLTANLNPIGYISETFSETFPLTPNSS